MQPAVFEDLAQEAVAACRQSLSAASDLLVARPDSGKIHGQLFLVRHLLILKEMTANVEMIRKDRAKEWAGMTGTSRVGDEANVKMRSKVCWRTLHPCSATGQIHRRAWSTFRMRKW